VACSEIGFQQVSSVSSIATTKGGGRHVDHVVDQLVNILSEMVNKKIKNSSQVQIKYHL
jgi:DNA gyrase/topoisomerase IV subunit B